MAMVLPEIRLLQAAIVLASELHFSRAADRLNMSQSTLSKQILKLERELGFPIFRHNHQAAELTDAGRVFIVEAREVLAHAEKAIHSARAVLDGPVEVLNVGKSSYTDPFLVSVLQSIHLPLFPNLKIKLWSDYSNELAHKVLNGNLDLALITGIPQKHKLSTLHVANYPFYILMSMDDDLAQHREVDMQQIDGRNWVLLGKHVNVHMHDMIYSVASAHGVHPSDIHYFTSPEEASELVHEHQGLAFLSHSTAWRVARDGLTLRPLADHRLRVITSLAVHADNRSRLVREFVRAVGKKCAEVGQMPQKSLALSA
jgi:DNA-binding transcriptional LysR family regulator